MSWQLFEARTKNSAAKETKSLRVARIPYLNTDPFFAGGVFDDSQLISAHPRGLGRLAAEGRVDAGPLALVDFWRLEKFFEPVGNFGIAVKQKAHSVLLFSKKRWEDLAGTVVGVTDQTSTSAHLLKVILASRYGLETKFQAKFQSSDQARLLIGDDALIAGINGLKGFPHRYDLGEEWHNWRRLPFVFARWVVRKTVPIVLKEDLADRLEGSLKRYQQIPAHVVRAGARRLGLSPAIVENYLNGFRFRLGAAEQKAVEAFRDLVTGKITGCGC